MNVNVKQFVSRNKRVLVALITGLYALSVFVSCEQQQQTGQSQDSSQTSSSQTSSSTNSSTTQTSTVTPANMDFEFTARDLDVGYDETTATKITLGGATATVSGDGATATDNTITIHSEGVFIISGTLTDGQIIVDVADTAKVQIVLDNAVINCNDQSAILIKQANKVFITLASGTQNKLSDSGDTYVTSDVDSNVDGVIFSKADLTINGTGSLEVNANYKHGIVSKDDLVITGGDITVTANGQGLYGKDCVKINDGNFKLTTQGDGMQSDNTEDKTRGFVYLAGGTYDINAQTDAVQAETVLQVDSGTYTLTTGGGSVNVSMDDEGNANEAWGRPSGGGGRGTLPDGTSLPEGERPTKPDGTTMPDGMVPEGMVPEGMVPPSSDGESESADNTQDITATSAGITALVTTTTTDTTTTTENVAVSSKGMKAGANLIINGGEFVIDSSDDALHSNGDLSVSGGVLEISSGDDGIHADAVLVIDNGEITIAKSYEGIEGKSIEINSGTIEVNANDDGLNSAGGNDSSAMGGRPGQNSFASGGDTYIHINGGDIDINAQGDGVDSNGDLVVEGGTVYVSGPSNSGNSALDYDGNGSVNGGVVIAVGGAEMAQGFTDTGTQCSLLYNLPSVVSADTAVTISDSSGKELGTFTPSHNYQSVVISTKELKQGETYTIKAGTQTVEVTLDGIVTSNGGTGMGGFGGGGKR